MLRETILMQLNLHKILVDKKPKQRRERFAAVMAGIRDYTAEELDGELLDLHATNRSLNSSLIQGADDFLEELRNRGILLKDQEKLEIIFSD